MINVTKTDLPKREKFDKYLDEIWKTHWITNNGKFVQLLEKKLKNFLKVKNLTLVSNGTSGLQLVLKALDLEGEIITTPFTFPATTNAILWEGLTPIFADIDIETFNIDPKDVERKISNKTSAILAVHVYGNPCDVEKLEEIAKKYNLKLIFDAAHAFNVEYKNKSILEYGDASILSFHATKIFHTIEGGAIATRNKNILEKLKLLKNFGIKSDEEVLLPGINAKMNEFQAAMGLSNIPTIEKNTVKRMKIYQIYKTKLKNLKKIKFQKLTSSKYNCSYMPVVFENQKTRDKIYRKLITNNIKARKYFYPLTSSFDYVKKNTPVYKLNNAKQISDSVLCLPIYPELKLGELNSIIKIVNNSISFIKQVE